MIVDEGLHDSTLGTSTMSNAMTLLVEFLVVVPGGDRSAALLVEDGAHRTCVDAPPDASENNLGNVHVVGC